MSDVIGTIDYAELEKEIIADLEKELKELEIKKIVQRQVEKRLKEIEWDKLLEKELDGVVSQQVDTTQDYWLNSLRRFKEQLADKYE